MKNISILILLVVVLGGIYIIIKKDTETDIIQPETVVEEINTTTEEPIDDSTPQELYDSIEEDITENVNDSEPENVKEFTLDSFNFGYSIEKIEVNEGDTVTINLTNSNGFHNLLIDEFDVETESIGVGDSTSITFIADKSGVNEFYCSVGNHRAQGMVGTLIVE